MSRSHPNSSRALAQRSLLGEMEGVSPFGRNRNPRRRRVQAGADAPDGFTAALKLVVEYGKLAREAMEGSTRTRCPRCGRLGPTSSASGARSSGGSRGPGSLCRNCQEPQGRSPRAEGELFALP